MTRSAYPPSYPLAAGTPRPRAHPLHISTASQRGRAARAAGAANQAGPAVRALAELHAARELVDARRALVHAFTAAAAIADPVRAAREANAIAFRLGTIRGELQRLSRWAAHLAGDPCAADTENGADGARRAGSGAGPRSGSQHGGVPWQ